MSSLHRAPSLALALALVTSLCFAGPVHADNAWAPEGWKVTAPEGDGWTLPAVPKDDLLPADEQILRFNNGAEPKTLDPGLMTGVPEHTLAMAMFEGLTVPHPKTLEPMPGQARAWAVSPDGMTWRFLIRKTAKWSNGDALNAHDFVATWKRVLTPATGAKYAGQLYVVKGAERFNLRLTPQGVAALWKQVKAGEMTEQALIEAIGKRGLTFQPDAGTLKAVVDAGASDAVLDAVRKAGAPFGWDQVGIRAIGDHVLEVELVGPTPYFLQLTYFDTLFPVHIKTVEKHGIKWTRPENIVTNGPFLLKEWSPRNRIVFEKNPGYWNAGRVHLKTIIARPIEDQNTAMTKYLSEELDWIRSVPASRIDEAKKHPDYFVQPYLGTYYYSFNITKAPFDKVKVRRALAMAINRVAICRDVLKSGEIPATGFCPPGLHGYAGVKGDKYDPVKARQLLAEAGHGGGAGFPEIELLYNNNETHKLIAEAIVAMWKQTLGINVKLRNAEWKVYLENVTQLKYQIARRGWIGDYGDPNTFLDMWLSGGGNNNTGWASPKYDALIKKAAVTADPKARMQIFAEAEQLLLTELPVIPIYHYVNKGFKAPTVGGWHENIRDLHPFQFIYMTE